MSAQRMLENLRYLIRVENKEPASVVTFADLAYILSHDMEEVSGVTVRKKFVKPILEDVRAYCRLRGNSVDPEKFWNHYEANGWKVGRNPMKDWHAAVRTWERSSGPVSGNGSMFTQEEGRL